MPRFTREYIEKKIDSKMMLKNDAIYQEMLDIYDELKSRKELKNTPDIEFAMLSISAVLRAEYKCVTTDILTDLLNEIDRHLTDILYL